MSNFNYLYTNVFGAIKTTGSGCFSGARDDRGKYATITMNSLDIKYKLNQEMVYKYINSDSPLYLGKEFKINEKVFFGAYAGLKNSNGRSNNANIAYRFVCNGSDVSFNPAYLINNSYLIKNIYSNQITNELWFNKILADTTIEEKINDIYEVINFGDVQLSPVTNITSLFYNNYRNVVLHVIDELLISNFKKQIIIQGSAVDNAAIIQMVLLLLPASLAANLSFNTNVKDSSSLSEVNIAGVSDSINLPKTENSIVITASEKVNLKTYYARILLRNDTLFTCVSKLTYDAKVNIDSYNLNLDAIFIDESNFEQCFDLLKYALNTYDTKVLLREPKIFIGIDNILLNTSLLLKLDMFKLSKYIVCAKYEEEGIFKEYVIRFLSKLNYVIFNETDKTKYIYLIQLATMILKDNSISNLLNSHNLANLCNEFYVGLEEFLNNSCLTGFADYFHLIIDIMIKYLGDQKHLYENSIMLLFNNYENEAAIKTIELLFNNAINVDYNYVLIKGLTLSDVTIDFEEDASNNKSKIYNYVKSIITNPSNIDKNASFYADVKSLDNSIDLSWIEAYLIKPITTLQEVYNLNKNITDPSILHQVHKKTSTFFSNNLELINYETYMDIKLIYSRYENDYTKDFYEIEEKVINRLNLIGNEITGINNSKAILTGEFRQKRMSFIAKQNQIFGDAYVGKSNNIQINSLFEKNKKEELTDGVKEPDPVVKQTIVKPKKANTNTANAEDNFKVLIFTSILLGITLILLIPIFIIAKHLVKYCLLFGVLSVCISFRELIRFKDESLRKKYLYVFLNNLFIVYIPLIIFTIAVFIIMYAL